MHAKAVGQLCYLFGPLSMYHPATKTVSWPHSCPAGQSIPWCTHAVQEWPRRQRRRPILDDGQPAHMTRALTENPQTHTPWPHMHTDTHALTHVPVRGTHTQAPHVIHAHTCTGQAQGVYTCIYAVAGSSGRCGRHDTHAPSATAAAAAPRDCAAVAGPPQRLQLLPRTPFRWLVPAARACLAAWWRWWT